MGRHPSFTRSLLQANAMRQLPGLGEVACPVLFVAGEKEPKAVKRSNVMLAELMPNAQSQMVPVYGARLACRGARFALSNGSGMG